MRGPTSKGGEGRERGGDERGGEGGEGKGGEGRWEGGEGRGGRKRERRGGLSGNVAEQAFCLKSAPARSSHNIDLLG